MSANRAQNPNLAEPTAQLPLAPDGGAKETAAQSAAAQSAATQSAAAQSAGAENAGELERLVTALDYADGFAIFLARCNVPVERHRLIAEATRRLAARQRQVLELHFDEPVRDLRSHLRHVLHEHGFAPPPPATSAQPQPTPELALAEPLASYRATVTPVIFISGLEFSIPFDQPNAPLLGELNLGRELFRRDAPYPMLLWLPDYAITAVARYAPDFWAWRSAVFAFHTPEPQRSAFLQTLARDEADWRAVMNLRPGEKERRRRLLESLLDDYAALPDDPRTQAERGDLLFSLGQINQVLNQLDQALAYYEQSLTIQREIGDKAGEGQSLNNISQIYDARGDYGTALDYLEQSLKISQEIGDKAGEGTTLNNMATTAYARGDYGTALDYLEQSLKIRQEIGDKAGEGTTLNNISQIFKARGDYGTALDYLEQSLTIQREIGDVAGVCATLFNMGHIYWQNNEQQEALAAWITVYGLANQIGLAQVLQALEKLAGDLGLEGGLAGWAELAAQRNSTPINAGDAD